MGLPPRARRCARKLPAAKNAVGAQHRRASDAIHFYTQRIERLYTQRIERPGAQLWAIILAGLTIAAAAALWDHNAGLTVTASPKLTP
jgi:hypothetical protein